MLLFCDLLLLAFGVLVCTAQGLGLFGGFGCKYRKQNLSFVSAMPKDTGISACSLEQVVLCSSPGG